ncbi:cyclic-di-AMP receptor, partial [Staphylococcus epidermidis]|uniref:cyclic-di-AMP receptor n=1 Tax=Staphylococcus epidermidis TaxID=1282 RepID=UPI0011A1C378
MSYNNKSTCIKIKIIIPILQHQHTQHLSHQLLKNNFTPTNLPTTPPFLTPPNTTFLSPLNHHPLHHVLSLIHNTSPNTHQLLSPITPIPGTADSY